MHCLTDDDSRQGERFFPSALKKPSLSFSTLVFPFYWQPRYRIFIKIDDNLILHVFDYPITKSTSSLRTDF